MRFAALAAVCCCRWPQTSAVTRSSEWPGNIENFYQLDTGRDEQTGGRVAQVVETHPRETRTLSHGVQGTQDIPRMQPRADGHRPPLAFSAPAIGREHETGIHPLLSGLRRVVVGVVVPRRRPHRIDEG